MQNLNSKYKEKYEMKVTASAGCFENATLSEIFGWNCRD